MLPALTIAAEYPDWAYPVTPPPAKLDSVVLKSLPGSTRQYTEEQIGDNFNPPDWFPNEHPPMPEVVAHGGPRPAARACAQCHLTTGDGHPESAGVSGLTANYIIRQMAAFKNGERTGGRAGVMVAMAKVLSDEQVKSAAEYFAQIKPLPGYNKVVETETVPTTYVGAGGMRFATPDGKREPIGQRIIVLPQNPEHAELRDPKSGFIDYVPPGSLARGAALMSGIEGKTVNCTICHGPTLTGLGEVPRIAGRSATYTFRQLNDMKNGNRKGAWVELMKQVVVNLTDDDMIALSAYLGSLDP
jgi:cytochrome c553